MAAGFVRRNGDGPRPAELPTHYRIVGVDETDVDGNCISWLSPIVKALLKKRVGQQVRFHTLDGEQVLEILDVTFQE